MANRDEALIEELAGGLKPVRAMRFRSGLVQMLAALAVMIAVSVMLFGTKGMLLQRETSDFAFIANGLFLILGLAASAGAVTMGMPQVGNRQESWKWALAGALLVPGFALVSLSPYWRGIPAYLTAAYAWREMHCILAGLGLSLGIAAVMILWLRRGAPSSPDRAGFLVGLGAASLGIFAFGVSCPYDDLAHLALSHSGCILAGAIIGRLIVPRLIRW